MNQERQIKTTINDIEKCQDKNGNPYFKICANWGVQSKILYAFSMDFNLNPETLTTLSNSSYNLINRPVLITYQEQANKDNDGTFYKIKQIELVN